MNEPSYQQWQYLQVIDSWWFWGLLSWSHWQFQDNFSCGVLLERFYFFCLGTLRWVRRSLWSRQWRHRLSSAGRCWKGIVSSLVGHWTWTMCLRRAVSHLRAVWGRRRNGWEFSRDRAWGTFFCSLGIDGLRVWTLEVKLIFCQCIHLKVLLGFLLNRWVHSRASGQISCTLKVWGCVCRCT
jgi:hypothetical protein